jgi:hypothetical protein
VKHEAYAAMQARLEYVRDMTYRLEEVEGRTGLTVALLRHWREEERALEDALVGDDPLVLASLDYLRHYYEESDLVLRTEPGGRWMRLGGNEAWVLVDVAIGDDYGTLDHWKPYAIWRNTGNVYRVERGGAVEDDPIFEPAKSLDL